MSDTGCIIQQKWQQVHAMHGLSIKQYVYLAYPDRTHVLPTSLPQGQTSDSRTQEGTLAMSFLSTMAPRLSL